MATYIALIDFTDQGARTIQDSPRRATAFTESAERAGVTVKDLFWTIGEHDGVLILEGPDEQAICSVLLALVQGGNVRTHTLRAFDRFEMENILTGSE